MSSAPTSSMELPNNYPLFFQPSISLIFHSVIQTFSVLLKSPISPSMCTQSHKQIILSPLQRENKSPYPRKLWTSYSKLYNYCVFLTLSTSFYLSRGCPILPMKLIPSPRCTIPLLFHLYNHALSIIIFLLFFLIYFFLI